MWTRKTTPDDVSYIVNHQDMTLSALAERLGLSPRTVATIRATQTLDVCAGRPRACLQCPFPDCRLEARAGMTAGEYEFVESGMEGARYD